MVISRFARVFLLIALCVPMISGESAPVVQAAPPTHTQTTASAPGFWGKLIAHGLNAATLCAITGALTFGIPELYKRYKKSPQVQQPNPDNKASLSRATSYLYNTGQTWYGWARKAFYNCWHAATKVQTKLIESGSIERTDTGDRETQTEALKSSAEKMSLAQAIPNGNVQVVEKWLEHDGTLRSTSIIDQQTDLAMTGAMMAAQYAHDDIFNLFLIQSEVDKRDKNGMTALHYALGKRAPQLNSEADENYLKRLKVQDSKRANIVKTLIDSWADLNAQDNDGRTPLMCAAENGWNEAAAVLIDAIKEADLPVHVVSRDNLTALKIAIMQRNVSFIEKLISKFGSAIIPDQISEFAVNYFNENPFGQDEQEDIIQLVANPQQNINDRIQISIESAYEDGVERRSKAIINPAIQAPHGTVSATRTTATDRHSRSVSSQQSKQKKKKKKAPKPTLQVNPEDSTIHQIDTRALDHYFEDSPVNV